MKYWIEKGAEPSKLLLGMAAYGHGFILADEKENGFYAKTNGPIEGGPYTRERGMWGYNEYCEFMKGDPQWEFHRVRSPQFQFVFRQQATLRSPL